LKELPNEMTSSVAGSSVQTDLELIDRSRLGDSNAFGELLSRHYHKCAKLAGFILRDREGASDEVQKACWKAFEHLDQYRGTAEFSTWLSRIVVNECRMVLRVNRRTQFVHLDAAGSETGMELPAAAHDPEYDLMKREMADVVRKEVRHLPTLMRNVVLLRDVEGLPMPEVASRLGVTVAAAKSRLVRARLEMRARVARHFGSNGHHVRSTVRSLPARSVRGGSNA
jgi:RNA polymerase sigma-70 factor (ECF subfamily)